MAKPRQAKKKGVSIDFSGVESGGGRAIPDGNYTVEVVTCEEEESSSGNPMLKWKYRVISGPAKGATIYDNTSLQPQALWRLKTLLECFGMDDLDSSVDLDLEEVIGKSVDVEITNETYQGKTRPKITGFLGGGGESGAKTEPEDDAESDDEPVASAPARKSKTANPVAKIKIGQTVTFEDEDGKKLKGIVTALDGDDATVDVKGEEWDLSVDELTKA